MAGRSSSRILGQLPAVRLISCHELDLMRIVSSSCRTHLA
ncbi:hypothetical protein EV378_2154 [Pseudonocardia endophytica]|uniref:Uncharacterized protein n=1 Tax=Pseudonocardia endophytica TaxID=401976 RepID=A0A4R1HUE9_PSEEN|nr:hypothetical protein EV378_2154 [Pseudonocardia endophytica]